MKFIIETEKGTKIEMEQGQEVVMDLDDVTYKITIE